MHTVNGLASDGYPDEKAPLTIFVLDLLNSSFEDFAFIRYSVRKFLAAQPLLLPSPAEMMVIGNESLETDSRPHPKHAGSALRAGPPGACNPIQVGGR